MTRTLKTLLAVALFGSLLVACGSSGSKAGSAAAYGGGSPSTSPAASNPAGAEAPPVSIPGGANDHGTKTVTGNQVAVEQDDFYFSPTFIPAPAGATITVALHNEGSASHTFDITSQHIDVVLAPGQEKTVQVTMPSGGDHLVFFCRFHQSQGMQGALIAEA